MTTSGPIPKSAATRQRRNRTSTAARFETSEAPITKAPALGACPNDESGKWHPRTASWWREVWASPMAREYLKADSMGLLELAVLVDRFWRVPSSALAAEIRLQRQCYGLTPIDRRRLQWEIARAEEADRKRKPPRPATSSDDPRRGLRAV